MSVLSPVLVFLFGLLRNYRWMGENSIVMLLYGAVWQQSYVELTVEIRQFRGRGETWSPGDDPIFVRRYTLFLQ